MNEEAERWFMQATEDLATAKILFDSQRYGPCAFFCQQAAEKTIKAALYSLGERPWGHSVSSLLDQYCLARNVNPEHAPRARAEALDEHYILPRYPDARVDADAHYGRETASEALADARALLAYINEGAENARDDSDDRSIADLG